VVEEFKQRYLNQPYGDVWLHLRPLAYKVHPYQWATIGKEISHIENATMEDVQDFFYRHYHPQNATLCVAGDVTVTEVEKLCKKWFSDIPSKQRLLKNLPQEPVQEEYRKVVLERKVPANAIYMAFKVPKKYGEGYFEVDLVSDILGKGKASRLYRKLVLEESLLSSVSCYQTASLDEGLLVINGMLREHATFEEAESCIWEVIDLLIQDGLEENELKKVKNQALLYEGYGDIEILSRAMKIASCANTGDVSWVNKELEIIKSVSENEVIQAARNLLVYHKASVLWYG
ncbi:MAG: M16 family metallopeptidase, partial [Leadbetterella sp.]